MYNPSWEAKWREIQRDDPDRLNQVINFVRWAEGRYGVGSRGAALATEFVLTKILKYWGESNGRQKDGESEQESGQGQAPGQKVLQEARAGLQAVVPAQEAE